MLSLLSGGQAALLAVVIVVVVQLARPVIRSRHIRQLPLPRAREWIWGHEKAVFMGEPGLAYRRWTGECGLTYRIKAAFGARDLLVLEDPDGIAHILGKKIYDYHHSEVVRPRVARLLGQGLGWIEGEGEHKRMRRLVGPALAPENIKGMSDDIHDAALNVINNMVQYVEGRHASAEVNILDWTSKATLNVIGRAIFGHDFENGESEDAQQILSARKKGVSPIARYAGFLTLMLLRRFPILNRLPINAIQAQGIAKLTVQRGVAIEMVKRSKSIYVGGSSKAQRDLLTRLIAAREENQLSETELYEQISTFVISGHETTTQTLGFTIWELARHPQIQHKLRDEVLAFGLAPTYDDFQSKLPYLDAVLRETLRLYPGLPYMERVAMKDDVIPLRNSVSLGNGKVSNEVFVTEGQSVVIPIIAIHRLEQIWDQSDDFIPERWFGQLPSADKLYSGWSNTLAFSDGPRNCVGWRLAVFQYKVLLCAMLSRFHFAAVDKEVTLKISSSLQPWVASEMEKGPQLPVVVELL